MILNLKDINNLTLIKSKTMENLNEWKQKFMKDVELFIKNYGEKPTCIPEPEFKVGQWVCFLPEIAEKRGLKTNVWNKPHILRISEIRDDSLRFDKDQHPYENRTLSNNCNCFRLATPAEIENHLRKICDEKGFVGSVRMNSSTIDPTWNKDQIYSLNDKGLYHPNNDEFIKGGITLYKQGKFAEVIPDKKNLPCSKIEYINFLRDYNIEVKTCNDEFTINKFLNQYKF